MEWAKLSLDLAPVVLSNKEDSLTWLPSADGVFSTKSLMMNMGKKVEAINPTLAKTIWKGHQPKKVKFFLWEIAHKAISMHVRSEFLDNDSQYVRMASHIS